MPDPTVQTVVNQFDALLTQADLAGVAFIASASHTHYLLHMHASWNSVREEQHNGLFALRIRCKRADFGTEEEWQGSMTRTVGLVVGLLDTMAHSTEALSLMLRMLGKKMNIEHVSQHEPAVAVPILTEDREPRIEASDLIAAANEESKRFPLPPVRLEIDETMLAGIVGTMQLAMRHPTFKEKRGPTYQAMRSLIDQIIAQLPANRPYLKKLLELGNDPDFDQ